jgi:hypothetical protein
MPNIHNLAFPLEKYGMKNADHTGNPTIFYPIDEPHGMIKVSRFPAAVCTYNELVWLCILLFRRLLDAPLRDCNGQ